MSEPVQLEVPRLPFQFEAKTDFDSEETKSGYAAGMRYTVREGNTKLAALVAAWVKEGKVHILSPEQTKALAFENRVAGKAVVK